MVLRLWQKMVQCQCDDEKWHVASWCCCRWISHDEEVGGYGGGYSKPCILVAALERADMGSWPTRKGSHEEVHVPRLAAVQISLHRMVTEVSSSSLIMEQGVGGVLYFSYCNWTHKNEVKWRCECPMNAAVQTRPYEVVIEISSLSQTSPLVGLDERSWEEL